MAYTYEPEIEEEDDGYSIPKIIVAVLLLVLVGAGAYIYFQQKKLTTSVSYLLDSKKQAEQDLNEMIEKYNLAIEDNGSLESELEEERDAIIRYRDSIKNIKNEDVTEDANFRETIKQLKKNSALQFTEHLVPLVTKTSPVTLNNNSIENPLPTNTKKTITDSSSETDNNNSPNKTEEKTKTKEKTPTTTTTFKRVEIPPTYPGCNGNPTQKKACFSKKIKKHLARKFNSSIVNDLNLTPGKKRIWISFNVDKFGHVVNVHARGPKKMPAHAKNILEKEAVKTIKKLPKMIAARQNGSSVDMSFSVPLSFVVQY